MRMGKVRPGWMQWRIKGALCMKTNLSEKRITTGKLTELALLTAAALILYVVELQLPNPIPIPGVKLGLANIVTVYAVYRYRPAEVLMVVLVRIFLGSLYGGSMMTFLYSLAGSLLCLLGMLLLRKVTDDRTIWLASVLGAVLHNLGQMTVAVLIAGKSVLFYLPFLMTAGCIAGAFTGFTAQLVRNRLAGKS